MTIELVGGRVRVVERRARKLKLPSRLERDGALAVGVIEADQVSVVLNAVPAKMGAHAFQQRPDPSLAPIRDGRMIGAIEWDLLVLRADPERARRLASRLEPGDERVTQFDDFTIDDVPSHKGAYPRGRRTGEPAR